MDDKRKPDLDLLYQGSLGCIVLLIVLKLALFIGLVWVAWHFISKYW